jgi:O-antigen/teichoic acid export membrane protein
VTDVDRSIGRAFLSIFGAKLTTSVISILSLPLVVRLLGSDGYGDYAFLMSVFSLLMILVSSGVTEGVQKFVAEQREDPHWRRGVVGFYLRLALVLAGLGAIGVGLVAASGVVSTLGPDYVAYFYLLAGFVVTAQMRSFTRRALMGLGMERYSEPLRVVEKLVWLGLGLALAAVGYGVAAFLVSNVVAAAVVAVVGFGVVRKRIPLRKALRTRTVSRRELLSFNILNILLVVMMMSLFHVDVVMVRLLAGDSEAGHYKAALALAEYLWFVPLALQSLLLHSASELWSNDRVDRITDLASRLTRYVLLLTVLMGCGIYALADRFVPLYFGESFTAAIDPLILLLPGVLGFALARPLFAINQSTGRLVPVIAATGTSAVLNVVCNALFIPSFGIVGAAMATSLGYGSMFLFHAACARWFGYDPLEDVRPLAVLATVVVGGGAIVIVEPLISSDLLALAVVPVAGALLYTAVAVLTGAVDVAELRVAVGELPAPLGPSLQSLLSEG